MAARTPPWKRPVVFGPFALDHAEGPLWRGSAAVQLRRKSWEVLCYLAARPHVLVSNDELLEAVWPGVNVTPQTLTNVIRELRNALADPPRAPQFIETVHGRGHVFRGAPAARGRLPAIG